MIEWIQQISSRSLNTAQPEHREDCAAGGGGTLSFTCPQECVLLSVTKRDHIALVEKLPPLTEFLFLLNEGLIAAEMCAGANKEEKQWTEACSSPDQTNNEKNPETKRKVVACESIFR